jgi:predicted secreted protein
MTVFSAFVLYAVLWFLTLFVVLPIRLTTQGEAGEVVPGTHSSAPSDPQLGKRLKITTLASAVIWAIVAGIVVSGAIGVDDVDIFRRLTVG